MKRLILFRHGEAEDRAKSGRDFDRALTARGRADAAATGEALATAGFVPDIALVSTAARARGTWEVAAASFPAARLDPRPEFYDTNPDALLAAAMAMDGFETVMAVGHNPTLHALFHALAHASQDAAMIGRAERGFPKGAAAAFAFDAGGVIRAEGFFPPASARGRYG